MEEEARWPKQSLVQWTPIGDNCIVFVLSWCLLTQMYKWVLVTEQWGQGAAEITSIRTTTWSKASFASPCNINNFVGIKNSKG